MTVVISSSFVLSANEDNLNLDSPIIGYDNQVTAGNVSATTEADGYPVSNLANPGTSPRHRWKSGAALPTAEEVITVLLNPVEDVDYLAIARHNFGSSQASVTVEGVSTEPGSPADYFTLVEEHLLADDAPVIFRFTKQPLYAIRLVIGPSQSAPIATPYLAVLYVGELLMLQRRIFVGHTPITYGRSQVIANHRSIAGDFVGRVILSEKHATTIETKHLTSIWYRTYFEPFLIAAKEIPFFFNWRPGTYPRETGFAWLSGDPQPNNQLPNGMMQISFDIEGIA
jgi:hypothetical protein